MSTEFQLGKWKKKDGGDDCMKEHDERVKNVCVSCNQIACN